MSHTHLRSDVDLAAPAALISLATGAWLAQALYVAARLGIADLLREGARSAEQLARETATHAPTLARLLRALATGGVLVEVEDAAGHFALTELGACLRSDVPNSVRDTVIMYGSENFWHTWGDLLHCVQTGESAMRHLFGASNPFAYYADHPELAAVANAGFAGIARIEAHAVVAAYAFPERATVVDVGGGQGQLLATILQAHPALRGVLFDLPQVAERASVLLERAGLADRCRVVAGDAFKEVPPGGDLYLLSRVIHDWDDEHASAILHACRHAMPSEATLLVIESVLPHRMDDSPLARYATLADLNMLVRTGGRERSVEEYRALLAAAGFTLARIIPTQIAYSIMQAQPA